MCYRKRLKFYNNILTNESGIALPTALYLLLILSAIGAIYAKSSVQGLKIVSLSLATANTFNIAEGAVHESIRQMIAYPHLWQEKPTLSSKPADYTEYSPLSYPVTNGIPSCTGASCQRNLYPTGGGIIKNFGPVGGDGESIRGGLPITNQLDPEDPVTSDITLASQLGWTQVEHLDESFPSSSSIGGDLANNPVAGGAAKNIRFRITGTALRKVKGEQGKSVIITVVEMPAS